MDTAISPSDTFQAFQGCTLVEFPADNYLEHDEFELRSSESIIISRDNYTKLVAFSQRASVSLHEVLLAAISVLHFRYTGAVRAALALCISQQYNEPLAAYIQVDEQDALIDVIRAASKVVAQLKVTGVPFQSTLPKLAKNASNAPGVSHPVLVDLSNTPASMSPQSIFPMVWRACQSEDRFNVDVCFDPTRFGPNTVQALLTNVVDVILATVASPDLTVDVVPFPHALEQLVAARIPLDAISTSLEPRPSLAQAFAEAASIYSDLPALVDGDLTLTYREVDILSSALARRILDATKQQETHAFVSFCIPPGAIAVLTILAIVKSGAAYVPLDVRFPAQRLTSLVEDSGASLIITTAEAPAFDFNKERVARLDVTDCLENWKSLVDGMLPEGGDGPVSPTDSSGEIAYVFYTSGSTGKPKGVLIKQASVVAFVSNRDVFTWGPGHRIAQINNLAWDASVFDVWGTLLLGATLVCFERFDALDPPALAQRFAAAGIDTCFMTTSLFRHVLDGAPGAFAGLRQLLVGGEALFFETVHALRAAAPQLVFRNVYGTTETTVFSTRFDVSPGEPLPAQGAVPIGRPFRTSRKIVVDRAGRLVPPGVVGELLVGGEGVAAGYLNRPEESARAIGTLRVEGLSGNTRFYRTGDAVRWCGGQLHFVGRMMAGQVKIRGQRLEIGEVEAAIVRTGLVASVAVSYHKPDNGTASLLAYVVLDHNIKTQDVDSGDAEGFQDASAATNDESIFIENWRDMYDDLYARHDLDKARNDFIGWDSMITGEPIPKHEMIAWLQDTLRPLREQHPRTVFEVGCGTGIFVYHILPAVEHMWAIEPSSEAVNGLCAEMDASGQADKIDVWCSTADKITELPAFEADVVFMNSVVQYFPSEAYLYQVIVDTASRCAPGGRIVVGDVRSLPCNSLLGTAIAVHGWQHELEHRTVRDLCNELLNRDKHRSELLVDPSFFTDLCRTIPAVAHVEIVPKRMEYCNELSQFRYQVVVHVNTELPLVVPEQWYDYEALRWEASDLEDRVHTFSMTDQTVFAVERIPNRFLSWELDAVSSIFSPTCNQFSKLGSVLPPRTGSAAHGWSAWELERLAEKYGITVKLSVARQKETMTLDAVFLKAPLNTDSYVSFKTVDSDPSTPSTFAVSRLKDLVVKARPEDGILKQLRATLPSYMVPDRIFSVQALPLLSSGKLDRRTLAAMAEQDAKLSTGMPAEYAHDDLPADKLEARLCEVYGELLSITSVSPLADFFVIGGHSLLATRLKSCLESEFHITLPLKTIFAHSTPRELANSIRQLRASSPALQKPVVQQAIATGDKRVYYPLSFAQDRMWFLQQLANYRSQNISYNSPHLLKLEGRVDALVLERTIQDIVARHEVLRTIYVEVEHEARTQVVDFRPDLEIEAVAPGLDEKSIQALIKENARRPFALDITPPFRATLFQVSPDLSYLLFCMHHVVVDGYSLDIIQDEMVEIYTAFRSGKDHTLTPLPLQYKEYAQWQRSDDFEDLLKPQVEYWTTQLADSQPMEWPIDFRRPEQLSQEAKTVTTCFPPELLARLEQVCQEERVTMFMMMATVFRIVHFHLTGYTDAAFSYPIANRNRPETERLIGFFVNTQVLRLIVRPGMSFLELLQHARAVSWAAFEHQDMPFERVVAIHNPTRELDRIPLAQIVFAYQTHKSAPFSLGDVEASVPDVDLNLTRFDLEVYFHPRAEGLHGEFFYSTDLYKEETIIELASRVHALLEQIIDDRDFIIHPPQSPRQHLPTPSDIAAYLHDYSPSEFPLDNPRRSDGSCAERGAHTFDLSPAVRDALSSTMKNEHELLILNFAAMAALNCRYTGSGDMTIGLATHDALDVAACRLSISRDIVLSTLMEDARVAVENASKFSGVSIKDVATVMQKPPSSVIHVVLCNETDIPPSKSQSLLVDFELRFSTQNSSLYQVSYDKSLFLPRSIEAFCDNFVDVLEYLLLHPTTSVEDIPFQHTMQQLCERDIPLIPAQPAPPASLSLIDAFQDSVNIYGDKVALEDGRLQLSYKQLDIATSILAMRIVGLIGDKCEFIAMCIPPSALTVLSILAIAKAGAAYVPLDVRHPVERLRMLLNACGTQLLITCSQSPDLAGAAENVISLDITNFLVDIDLSSPCAFVPIRRTDAAYLMYTSGSTGVPKGVPVRQTSVIALASNTELLAVHSGDRFAMINNLAWDVSVLDTWCALLVGATVVCFNRYDILDLVVLAGQFQTLNITGCFMSPALFRQALNLAPHLFRTLRVLQLGGEALYYEGLQKVKLVKPSILIRNLYGPTEACVSVTIHAVDVATMPPSGPVPIGRPLTTAQALVVDSECRLVPPGVIGELIIGGAGVGSGYLARPKETAEAFVELQFDGISQEPTRFYRTGDAVQWRTDGYLYFLGRINAGQVKIRGQRLELAEVEGAILGTGLAYDAVVVHLKSDHDESDHLVAYAVAATSLSPPEADALSSRLLEMLRKILPTFAVPYLVRWLPTLPVVPNGKLDRRALLLRAASDVATVQRTAAAGARDEPRDEVEARLCRIIESILGSKSINRSSNFFNAGGHSLLAPRLAFRVQEAFSVPFNLMDVFNKPTPKAMAERIRQLATDSTPSHLSPPSVPPSTVERLEILPKLVFSSRPNKPYLFCVPMFTGLGFSFAPLSRATDHFNVVALNDPCYCATEAFSANQASTRFAAGLRHAETYTLEDQAKYFHALIVEELHRMGGPAGGAVPLNILGYSYGGLVAIEVARLAQREGRMLNLFVLDSSAHPMQETDAVRAKADATAMLQLVMSTVGIRDEAGALGVRLRRDLEARVVANLRALRAHRVRPYTGHITLFRAEANADHGFAPVVGSLDEVVLHGNHYRLLEETAGNLPSIADKVFSAISVA